MFNAAGIRMRMSLVAVIVATEASVTASWLATVAPCPTVNVWFAVEESVASAWMLMVLLSVAAVAPVRPPPAAGWSP
jgi:hypothetical protein